MTDQQPDNNNVEQHINEVSGGTVIGQQTNIQQTIARVGGIIVILLVILAVLFFGVLPESNRRGMLEGVGVLATYTPTATVTPTATPTNTPMPTATPLEGIPAAEDEIVVVAAKFSGEYDAQIDVLEVIQEAAEEVGDIRVIPIGHMIETREQAQRVSDVYNATMVIYGRVAPGGVTVGYEISPRRSEILYEVEGDFRVSSTQVENFEAFIFEGMDARYILGLSTGQLYYFDKNYDLAIQWFSQAVGMVEQNPVRAGDLQANVLYFYRGNAYYNLGQYEQAIADYDQALELNPKLAEAYNNRGLAYRNRGQYEQAMTEANRAIELDPQFALAYTVRGSIHTTLGQHEQAIADYDRAIELDPEDALPYQGRGDVYAKLGQHLLAIANYDRAIELDPEDASAYYNRGIAFADLEQYDQALADYSKVIELDPEDAFAYNNRGIAHHNLGQYEQALADFDKAIELDPANAFAYNNRGIAYADRGELDLAIADFNRAIELNHDPLIWPYNNRGNAYRNRGQAGDLQRAIDDHDQAIQLDPQYANSHWGLGNVYYDLEHYEEALSSYRRYLELAGDNPSTFVVNRVYELEAQLGVTATPEGE